MILLANSPGTLGAMVAAVVVVAAFITGAYTRSLLRRRPELAWPALAWRIAAVGSVALLVCWLGLAPAIYVLAE